jgi:hypothetical protein
MHHGMLAIVRGRFRDTLPTFASVEPLLNPFALRIIVSAFSNIRTGPSAQQLPIGRLRSFSILETQEPPEGHPPDGSIYVAPSRQ